MKKLIGLIFLLFSSFSLFAENKWINDFNIAIGLPFYEIFMKDSDITNVTITGNGVILDVRERIIHKASGISFLVGLGIGTTKNKGGTTNLDDFSFDYSTIGGMGYTFVRNKRLIFSLMGIFGFDLPYIKGNSNDIKFTVLPLIFFTGADISATIRFNKNLGFFISSIIAIPIGGNIETKITGNEGNKVSDSHNIRTAGYYIRPSLGISIVLE